MTSTGRFGSAVRHTLSQSNYVCLQCRLRASTAIPTINPSISLTHSSRRHASYTDKLRKRIWGTETPPGQKDPYVKESVGDRERREREQENEEGKGLPSESENKPESTPEGEKGEAAEEGEGEEFEDDREFRTIEGLERVGGRGWGQAEWEAENSFQGFMESEKTETRKDVVVAVHRALVEAYALKEAGLPLVMDYYSLDPTEDYAKRVAESAKFEQDANGKMALVLESEELRRSILKCVTPQERADGAIKETEMDEEEVEEEAESKEAEETPFEFDKGDDTNLESKGSERLSLDEERTDPARSLDFEAQAPASDTWRNVSLEDATMKFVVLKRVMQLTGKRITDPDISSISTPGALLVHLVKKPKPKKIAEALQQSNPVVHLPNVQILNRRYGPIDRDDEIGRWKVIKQELEQRRLPITGRLFVTPREKYNNKTKI